MDMDYKITVEKIEKGEIPTCIVINELKEVGAKLCVVRGIRLEELEYCVKGFKMTKDIKGVTVSKCMTIVHDMARFFDIQDIGHLFDKYAWLEEEHLWIETIIRGTLAGDIKWKYSSGRFVSFDIPSILGGKRSKTELKSGTVEHKFYSQSSKCPVFRIFSRELFDVVVKIDKETNQMSHLHIL